jgi:hypothetical protein
MDNTETQVTELDRALAAAKARRNALNAKVDIALKPKAQVEPLTPEQKVARKAERKAISEARKVKSEAARTEKRALREAKRAAKVAAVGDAPKRSSKLERAASRLPELDEVTASVLSSTTELTRKQLVALAEHISYRAREIGTVSAKEVAVELKVGDLVNINLPGYEGVVGTLDKVQHIRCYVRVPNEKKPVYLFKTDVTPVTETIEVLEEDDADEDSVTEDTDTAVNE